MVADPGVGRRGRPQCAAISCLLRAPGASQRVPERYVGWFGEEKPGWKGSPAPSSQQIPWNYVFSSHERILQRLCLKSRSWGCCLAFPPVPACLADPLSLDLVGTFKNLFRDWCPLSYCGSTLQVGLCTGGGLFTAGSLLSLSSPISAACLVL